MASLVLSGDTSGSITVSAPAVAGSTTQTLVANTGTLAPIVSGTAQASTSGTSIDFTGIPSWVKRITVMFSGVSTNGTSDFLIQIGDSGGVETSGYGGAVTRFNGTLVSTSNTSAGYLFAGGSGVGAASLYTGKVMIEILTGSTYIISGLMGSNANVYTALGACAKTLSDTLTQVRITTVNGTDTFDAGTINILFE